jgi:enamine deaminase RidA (YjgF/YER057c/UK114 family)
VSTSPSARLRELGLTLPELAQPVGSYVPYKVVDGLYGQPMLYTSGMIPVVAGTPLHTGKLGAEVSLEDAQQCARQCVLNALAWVEQSGKGGLDRVRGVVQVRGFVACTADFYDQPKVLNAASDLLVEIFGEAGKHTRAAVGCPALPLNVPVEIDFLFAL